MTQVIVEDCGAGVTFQDGGWTGTIALGLSQGGVADQRAYAEASALLGHPAGVVLELAGFGGSFRVTQRTRFALTGGAMRVDIDGEAVLWSAVHTLETGQTLRIGASLSGVYGYLSFGGGIDAPLVMGSASTHRMSGIGRVVAAGDRLSLKHDPKMDRTALYLAPKQESHKAIRILPTVQTRLFDTEFIQRFEHTSFTRSARANRQGVVLEANDKFQLEGGQSIPSETALPGDIQLPGDGVPLVLLADCQTTGGYPRIASILPCDLPRVAQAEIGSKLNFSMISRQDGIAAERAEFAARQTLSAACQPIVRDPVKMRDLLSYNLIGGMITGRE